MDKFDFINIMVNFMQFYKIKYNKLSYTNSRYCGVLQFHHPKFPIDYQTLSNLRNVHFMHRQRGNKHSLINMFFH